MKYFYGVLCLLGTVLPYAAFVSWLVENGLNIGLFISEIHQSKIGLFAWLDVLVSAVVLIGFILIEGKRQSMPKLWVPIIGTCIVGVSLGLPLFLLMRELHLSSRKSE